MDFTVRRAEVIDIPELHEVRMSVRENVLRTASLVTEQHYRQMLKERGAGWVAEGEGRIYGFLIVDAVAQNVWALFVDPEREGQGVGSALHRMLLAWCTEHQVPRLKLSTAPGTRAEQFYLQKGWQRTGVTNDGEAAFEMSL